MPLKDLTQESALLDWCNQIYEDGVDRRRAWEGIWWQNIATYLGDFWVEWDPHSRELQEVVKPPRHRVRLPINLAQPIIRTEKAKLTKNRPILDILANSDEKSDIDASEVADKILNNYVEREFHMPRVRRRMLDYVLITGMGGTFVDWDPRAVGKRKVWTDPQGQPLTDPRAIEVYRNYYRKKKKAPRSMMMNVGEMAIRPYGPWNLIWDFSELYFEDAMYAVYSEVMDCDRAWMRWGDPNNYDDTRPSREDVAPGAIEKRLLTQFDMSHKLSLRGSDVQDLCLVHRMYVKPGHPFFPDGAHIVFVKEGILEAEPFPFQHGRLPFAQMGHIALPISQYSMSVMQQVRGPVMELSKTVSQLIENRNLMANPPWRLAKQHQIDEDKLDNKPGLKLVYQHNPNVPPPEPIQMPEMPSYVRELIPMTKEHIDLISGQGETTQGRVPPGARSGVAIAYLQEEDDTRLGPTVQEFEETMALTGHLILETIAEKYAAPRTVRVYKKHGEPDVFNFYGAMLNGNTEVVCQAGSALPRSKAAKQQFVLDLWDRTIEQDPRRVREMLELGTGEPEEFEKDLDEADRENSQMQQGQEVEALVWQNHAAHHYQHRNFMKSQDWKELPEEIQQIFLDHDAEHSAFERQLATEAAQQQLLNGGGQAPPSQNGQGQLPPGENGQTGQAAPQFQGAQSPRSLVNDQPQ